ncbi:MAG: heat-inducible transcriptional repressor HrcA [Acidimicrobiales bacterium]
MQVMLDERKAAILRAVVEAYIETAQPVGSHHVADAASVTVSSATVRNEMAVLEQEGYLRQPHTSAGRIPTDKGYRYFVDHFVETLPRGRLGATQIEQVRAFFARAHGELETVLHDTSRLVSDLTKYTALVTSPPPERASVRSVQLVGLAPRLALVVAVLSNGVVEKRSIEFDDDIGDDRMAAAGAHLASHLVGRPLADSYQPAVATGDPSTDAVVETTLASLAREPEADEHIFVGGAARMAAAFEAVETVHQVLDLLEHQYVIVTLLHDVLDRGLHVAIGSETGLEPLADCSVVVAPYIVEGEHTGTIGVLGPTRMNYPQALAAVAVVSKRLGRHLSEG